MRLKTIAKNIFKGFKNLKAPKIEEKINSTKPDFVASEKDFRFKEYTRKDKEDIFKNNGIAIDVFNLVTNKFEKLEIDNKNKFIYRNGVEVSRYVFKDRLYIPLIHLNNGELSADKHYNLIPGDIIYLKNKGCVGVAYHSDNEELMLARSQNHGDVFVNNLSSSEFEIIKVGSQENKSMVVLNNLFKKQYLIAHEKDNILFKIHHYRFIYDEELDFIKVRIVLKDNKNNKFIAKIDNNNLIENSLISLKTEISSMEIEFDEFETPYKKNSPLGMLVRKGLEHCLSKLAIPGFNNRIKITNDELGNFSIEQKLELRNLEVGLINSEVLKKEDGTFFIKNNVFEVCPELQKSKLSDIFLNNQFKFSKILDLKSMEMTCSLSAGGYIWAKKGFKFKEATTSMFFRSLFINSIKKMTLEDWMLFDKNIDECFFNLKKQELVNELSKPSFSSDGSHIENCFYYDNVNPLVFSEFKFKYVNKENQIVEVLRKKDKYKNDKIDDTLYSLGKSIMLGTTWDAIRII